VTAALDGPTAAAGCVVVGLTVLLSGWCRYQINGRRFRRRTITGAERFPSYGSAVFVRLWEGLVMSVATVLMWLAALGGAVLAVMLYRSR
jgi:hypothetical protein